MMEQLCKLANKFWKFYDQITIVSQLHRGRKTLKWLKRTWMCRYVSGYPFVPFLWTWCLKHTSREFLQICYQSPLWLSDDQIRMWWPQATVTSKNTLLDSIIHTIMIVKQNTNVQKHKLWSYDIQYLKDQRLFHCAIAQEEQLDLRMEVNNHKALILVSARQAMYLYQRHIIRTRWKSAANLVQIQDISLMRRKLWLASIH